MKKVKWSRRKSNWKSTNPQYEYHRQRQYMLNKKKVFSITVSELKKQPIENFFPYINKWAGCTVKRVERYNRQKNRVFEPYLFIPYQIKFKENYGSDFALYYPDESNPVFCDTVALQNLILEKNFAEIKFFFKETYKPNSIEHRDAILNSGNFICFIPREHNGTRIQYKNDLQVESRYFNIQGVTFDGDSDLKFYEPYFLETNQRVLIEGLKYGKKVFEAYDLLYWNKDLSHLPYKERLKYLKEYIDSFPVLKDKIVYPEFFNPQDTTILDSLDNRTMFTIHKDLSYVDVRGFYKIRNRTTLPMILTKVTRKDNELHGTFGVYGTKRKIVEICTVPIEIPDKKMKEINKIQSYKLLVDKTWYVEFDEFYGQKIRYVNPIAKISRTGLKHLYSCNIYVHLII